MEKFIVEHITEELLALKNNKKRLKKALKLSSQKEQANWQHKAFIKHVKFDLLVTKAEQRVYKTILNAITAHKESKNDKNQKKEKDYLVT